MHVFIDSIQKNVKNRKMLSTVYRRVTRTTTTTTHAAAKRCYTQWPFLKEEHVMISEMCKQFAETELKPHAAMLDKEHKFVLFIYILEFHV